MFKRKFSYCLMCVVAFGAVLMSSCNDKVDINASYLINEENQWESITDTRSNLMGVYGLLRAALVEDNGHWVYGELRYGDFTSYNRADLSAVINNDLNASFPLMRSLANWRKFYAVINAAAIFIERSGQVLEKDRRYTEVNWLQDVAQVRAIRAFAYFYMVRIWGDVPLITRSYDDGSFAEFARSNETTVLAYAERELLEAAQDLPYLYAGVGQTYYGEGNVHWADVLFNRNTAYAILAHIAAWQGKYLNAEVYTAFVLNNASRSGILAFSTDALTNIAGAFSSTYVSPMLLSIPANYGFGEATTSGHIEQLTLAAPLVLREYPDIYVSRDTITRVFTSINDQRFGIDTVSGLPRTAYFTNYNGELPIFSKIKVLRNGSTDPSYAVFGSRLMFTRLEEIYLLRAETLAVLGQRSDALRALNQIRSLRGFPAYNETDTTDVIDEIFAERRRELMGEGWRWYDQVRHNRIKAVNGTVQSLLYSGGIHWPIATEVLNNNSRLSQNPYWE